jgi:hypothetical protein
MAKVVARAIVGLRRDYCNSLYYNISKKDLSETRKNPEKTHWSDYASCADTHLVRRHAWVTPLAACQPSHQLQLALLTYKALTTATPTYLAKLLCHRVSTRHTRSAEQDLLFVPAVRTDFVSRAFQHAAPSVWNTLPLDIRSAPTLNLFKSKLRTHHFRWHADTRLVVGASGSSDVLAPYKCVYYITLFKTQEIRDRT